MLAEPDTVEYKFYVQRGLPWRRVVEFTTDAGIAYDLTDHGVDCKIRKPPRGVGPTVASNVASITDPPTVGLITLFLSAIQTQNLLRGTYSYDVLLIYPTGEARQILKGDITVEEYDSHA